MLDQQLIEDIKSRHGLAGDGFCYPIWYKTFDKFVRYPEFWDQNQQQIINSQYLPFWLDVSFSCSPDTNHIKSLLLQSVGCPDHEVTLKQIMAFVQLLGDKHA